MSVDVTSLPHTPPWYVHWRARHSAGAFAKQMRERLYYPRCNLQSLRPTVPLPAWISASSIVQTFFEFRIRDLSQNFYVILRVRLNLVANNRQFS
jgi:hypothetical protein